MSCGADTRAAKSRSRLRTEVVDAPEVCGGRTTAPLDREESELGNLEHSCPAGKKLRGDSDCGSGEGGFANLGAMDMSKVLTTCVFMDKIYADKLSCRGTHRPQLRSYTRVKKSVDGMAQTADVHSASGQQYIRSLCDHGLIPGG